MGQWWLLVAGGSDWDVFSRPAFSYVVSPPSASSAWLPAVWLLLSASYMAFSRQTPMHCLQSLRPCLLLSLGGGTENTFMAMMSPVKQPASYKTASPRASHNLWGRIALLMGTGIFLLQRPFSPRVITKQAGSSWPFPPGWWYERAGFCSSGPMLFLGCTHHTSRLGLSSSGII